MGKFIVTEKLDKKWNLEHFSHNVKKQRFSRFFLGPEFWTFLKMSIFHFPFYFLENLNNFQKEGAYNYGYNFNKKLYKCLIKIAGIYVV